MSRRTAVTETVTYETANCDVCGTEVATDEDAPDDAVERDAYAVVIGGGDVHSEVERDGNWDVEYHFEGEQSDSQLPTVEGRVVCDRCVESIHGLSGDLPRFTGAIPRELRSDPLADVSTEALVAVVLAVLALLVIVLLL